MTLIIYTLAKLEHGRCAHFAFAVCQNTTLKLTSLNGFITHLYLHFNTAHINTK